MDVPPERPEINTTSGTKTIAAPIEVVIQVLTDSSRKTEWQSSCTESRELGRNGETPVPNVPMEYVEYQVYTLPWPLSKRDYVFQGKWDIDFSDPDNKKATLDIKSCTHDDAPKASTAIVRGVLNMNVYKLASVDGGKATHVEATVNVDP